MPSPVVPPSVVGDNRLVAVHQLKIHLVGISPHIYRRVLVRGDTSLAELHHVFQVAMGWPFVQNFNQVRVRVVPDAGAITTVGTHGLRLCRAEPFYQFSGRPVPVVLELGAASVGGGLAAARRWLRLNGTKWT